MRKKTITLSVVAVLFTASASFAGLADVEYFDFTGWDHEIISTVGQTFEDICGDVDVTVTSIGSFDEPSSVSASGELIRSTHQNPGSHSFRFTFSEPLRLVIASLTVDPVEAHSIFTSSTETYYHDFGADPTVVPNGSGITINGNGFGIDDETGSAFGETLVGEPVNRVTITYSAAPLSSDKWGQWKVGKLVPEPNSVSLLGIGGLGLMLQLRKRRK